MEIALSEARQCGDDVPVGCVIFKDGELLARGRNVREAHNDPAGHAEIATMREAARVLGTWRLDGATIVCTLEPCPMCAEAIIQARVKRVVYGAADTLNGASGSAFNLFAPGRIFPIPEVIGGIKQEESARMLKDFFRARRAEKDAGRNRA